ncbi:MAG: inorganic pyrophosphatase [Acidobacteria bacterium]|nr:MAG: inorganic pyrophosphatase [Acidobacteriota bacterium]PYY15709.1 MAG: inorganic pyrophosphatase [Acidobacteriota bacterium]
MAKRKKGLANPAHLSAIDDDGQIQVVIETPKGSRNKYAFDPKQRTFKLKKVLPEGMVFPHDFGFIPSTKAEDGDPLDVLILMDQPAFPGCMVEARLVGVIEAEQSENGHTQRNDRLIAVCNASHTHSNIKSVKDVNESLLQEVEKFFVNYNENEGKKFKVLARKGPAAANQCLKRVLKAA